MKRRDLSPQGVRCASARSPHQRKRCIPLRAEPLEDRTLLSVTLGPITGATSPTALYLNGLYRDLLQRSAQPADINAWTSVLAGSPWTRSQVVQVLRNSTEYGTNLIRADYQSLLGRAPDASGQAYWLHFLQLGGTQELLTAQLTASDEYFAHHGSTASGWVTGVFQDQLGRAPDPATLTYAGGLLQNGTPRLALAMAFLNSPEADGRFIGGVYPQYLKRQPGQAEVTAWVAVMQGGWGTGYGRHSPDYDAVHHHLGPQDPQLRRPAHHL